MLLTPEQLADFKCKQNLQRVLPHRFVQLDADKQISMGLLKAMIAFDMGFPLQWPSPVVGK
jgi:hypothetical protein